jgi:toxin ParE1/3/4
VSLPVGLTAEAVDELRDASAWYEERRVGLGLVFVAAVDRAVDRIARWPGAGVLVDGVDPQLQVRRVPVERFPYSLAYVVGDDGVTVVAVVHGRRRPRYWVGRVEE